MSVLVSPKTNRIQFIGDGGVHPLTANLGAMVLCGDCRIICFTAQTSEVAARNDLNSRKRICLNCQTNDTDAALVQQIH